MANLRLIFNGDDFGRALSINAAIIRAHRQGVLTSASLMVTGDAVEDAVARARAHPTLAVGLHVVALGGRSALPPAELPHLVDLQGRLPGNPFLAGVSYFFNRTVRAELRREIEAQFECFLATGLPLAHVDGHYLMHLHPTVFSLLVPLAERYGGQGDLGLALLAPLPPGRGSRPACPHRLHRPRLRLAADRPHA
jgi:hopanoid biosynthesis associated protein HpnK